MITLIIGAAVGAAVMRAYDRRHPGNTLLGKRRY